MIGTVRHYMPSRGVIALVALAALIAVAILVAWPKLTGGSEAKPEALADTELAPEPWASDPEFDPANGNEPDLPEPVQAKPAPIDPVTGMPAASAGTNGSYTPPPPGERKRVYTATHPAGGVDSALLLNRTALAPPSAPDVVKVMISAANQIVGQPYRLGGGHAGWRSKGYDCSGAVSYALAGAGLVQAPMASGGFMSWGAPGRGHWLTIYANPGHVYAVIAGLRWDTVGDARGSGPRWHPLDAYPEGYVARHFPGL